MPARNAKLPFPCDENKLLCLQNEEVKHTLYDLMQSKQYSSNWNFLYHPAFAYIALAINL